MADKGKLYALVVGAMIEQLREGRRWTQAELARRVGVAQPTISRIERGQSQPQPFELHALAEALGTTAPQLTTWIHDAFARAAKAMKDAVKPAAGGDWLKTLSSLGSSGLAGLAGFAVATTLAERAKGK